MKAPTKIQHASKHGAIRLLYKKNSGTLTYVQKGGYQSAVDRNGVSLDAYIHTIYGLLLQKPAKSVLMIGCGGGTLGRMLHGAGKRLTIVDIDETSFKLAKSHFGLPAAIKCHVGDGLAFMQKTRQRFDAVIIDAFVGERIPKQFMGDTFCHAARRCLRAEGTLYINVCLEDKADLTADRLAHRFKDHGWMVRLHDQRGTARNAVIAAGNVKGLRKPHLLTAPLVEAGRIRRELRGAKFRPLKKLKP
jgi:spermidine synthase